jgi:hypothetical protein
MPGMGNNRPLQDPAAWPAKLDLMAPIAGFRLKNRHASFSKNPFTPDDRSPVSVSIKEQRGWI